MTYTSICVREEDRQSFLNYLKELRLYFEEIGVSDALHILLKTREMLAKPINYRVKKMLVEFFDQHNVSIIPLIPLIESLDPEDLQHYDGIRELINRIKDAVSEDIDVNELSKKLYETIQNYLKRKVDKEEREEIRQRLMGGKNCKEVSSEFLLPIQSVRAYKAHITRKNKK